MIPLDQDVIGVWVVKSAQGLWVCVLSEDSPQHKITSYMNGKHQSSCTVYSLPKGEIVERVREGIAGVMEAAETDRGWEVLRGHRGFQEFLNLLSGLPGMRGMV